ncbi:DnaJ DnaJ-class molecular chaperone with C-terminal Zn finger domain [Pyrenophora tritici-repentis]|uniref:DnaJ domain containing protein n=2 Tax=Pyrenophora tritici-repentis TaxID=45151 RepID=A0A2W1F057_9PLEO|nr:uncharacterized protein PTRG_06447 [Pyrenophora tritici-repentis Pt-1C-BFP]KAA8613520.1 Chaperone protein DnaJ [Pyrenophora tritici-repentis]EDU49367.1 predicted protein [Pyrenophora tritici-repentis Pt-1C-BFP]KAF7445232.1 Chaperone protein DnaJ [Pyrenophora tritici-repentis]KAF7565497.1 DnaJ, DnaJ-class molecular chaperone with C-terminal Zn finger domain protein [Pyrenophora tritici-repentis]KAG9380370.1 Chaperone protein DnaJ [Pyrenophora tritici-repentis]
MAPAVSKHDHYVVLQVRPGAPHEEIKASYRRLARLHHPDKNIGCIEATANTQLINAAWEVLSDVVKRQEYDRTRPKPTASKSSGPSSPNPNASTGSGPKPPNPTASASSGPKPQKPTASTSSGPKPAKPSPTTSSEQDDRSTPRQPDTTAQDEARAEAASNAKRQEWLNFEKYQEQQIRESVKVVNPLEALLSFLDAKIKENRAKLAANEPNAWSIFSYFKKRLSEEEKGELRKECVDLENVMRIQRISLDKANMQLQELRDELARREAQESVRLSSEKFEAQRRERARKAEAQEARWREQARQQAQQRAEREQREAAARKEADRARRERDRDLEEYLARLRAANEAAARNQQEQTKKRQAEQHAEEKRGKTSETCKHKAWWDKIEGRHDCGYCTAILYKFSQRCPGCGIASCDSCRRVLQAGGTPSVDHSRHGGNGRREEYHFWD